MSNKIRVMLVDDEYLAIEDIKMLIDWNELGFDITSDARSGRQALHHLENHAADLIITDISMPGMDGITLIEQIKKKHSGTLFLLLTAYAEIDYMKRAFQLGVEDYLIKDEITPDILRQKLLLIREKYIASRRLSYSFLQKTLQSYFSDIYAVLPTELPVIPHNNLFYCILAPDLILPWVDETILIKKASISKIISAALPFIEEYEEEGIENLCSFVAYNNKLMVLLYIRETASTSKVLEQMRKFSLNLIRDLYANLQLSFSCFYSPAPMILEKLHHDYFARQKAVRARYFLGSCLAEPLDSSRLFVTNHKLELTESDMKTIHEDPERHLSDFLSEHFERVLKFHNYIGLSHLLNICFSFILRSKAITQDELESIDFTDIHRIYTFLSDVFLRLDSTKNLTHSRETQKVIAYISEHYSDEQLTVSQLADEAGLSHTHFSRIFKQDTGETVWDYLTDYRIRKACDILKNTDAKIYEIADSTGYSSPQYFSQVFYRLVGMTPLDYRKKERL